MNLIKGKKLYVLFDPHISPAFIEVLTIQKQTDYLLFFEEKDAYYAVEFKEHLFYACSHNIAGNVLIVEKLWHLPLAKLVERGCSIANFFRRKPASQSYNKALKDNTLPIF